MWCKDYQGGRPYYITTAGISRQLRTTRLREAELLGAITGQPVVADTAYSDYGATVPANYQQKIVAAPPNLSEPIGVAPARYRPGHPVTDRRGRRPPARPGDELDHPARDTPGLYRERGRGLRARARQQLQHQPWAYLYSPPTVKDVKLSTGEIVTQTTPAGAAPNTAASVTAWDPWVGYFQLSRFKFVEASGGMPAHLDLASEQEILRVPNNRGACCHVAGDIDFDSNNNLWLVTGDDTPAGGGNSGGYAPFNSQLTNENQTITVAGATGGTFTLTFDGQTTAPIPFQLVTPTSRPRSRRCPTSTTSR